MFLAHMSYCVSSEQSWKTKIAITCTGYSEWFTQGEERGWTSILKLILEFFTSLKNSIPKARCDGAGLWSQQAGGRDRQILRSGEPAREILSQPSHPHRPKVNISVPTLVKPRSVLLAFVCLFVVCFLFVLPHWDWTQGLLCARQAC